MHCVGGQRGGHAASFRRWVGFLRLSNPRLVSILFSSPSLLQMKFFSETSPLVVASTIFGKSFSFYLPMAVQFVAY